MVPSFLFLACPVCVFYRGPNAPQKSSGRPPFMTRPEWLGSTTLRWNPWNGLFDRAVSGKVLRIIGS